jgi:TRAP-type C4-dicarboxylate transport system permease small subunit
VAKDSAIAAKGERSAVEAVYFTLAGIVLYFASDWVLQRIEVSVGRRLEHRSLVFFAILLGSALLVFALVRQLAGG